VLLSTRLRALIVSLPMSLFFLHVQAAEVHVSSINELTAAIAGASAGDVFVLADGTYLDNAFNIDADSITVRAATPGGVYLNGANSITIYGNHVTFSGFQFTSGDIGTGYLIIVYGSHNVLTQLNFNGYSAKKYIVIAPPSQYNVVSYCNFQNKPASATSGNLVHIDPDPTIPGYHKIRYCSFQKMPGAGGDNGNECIRISNGATSTYISRTIVEYCYFDSTGPGDSEVISVKCRENVLRCNTMKNNLHGNFCFRNGDSNIAYGNFFLNSGGIRIKVANNIYCYNNYFQNCGDGSITAPVKYVYDSGVGIPSHLNNLNFVHNTIVDGTPIEFDSHATGNTWANNVLKKSAGNIFSGGAAGITWAGNIYQGTLGLSIPAGMTNTDPKLTLNAYGFYGLSSLSPINNASAGYPAILDIANVDDDPSLLLDISGQARPATVTLKDAGCSEYNATGTVTNHPLALSDVGPSYLGGPVTGVADRSESRFQGSPSAFILFDAYPNPFNPETTVRFEMRDWGWVRLAVYDVLGREAAILVDEMRNPGSYSVVWSAAKYSSGLYFYRLQAHGYSETKKLLLVK
jgi:hypothetical protein